MNMTGVPADYATTYFNPPAVLRNPHAQTLLASLARKPAVTRRARGLLANSQPRQLACRDGVVLQASVSAPGRPAPTIVLIHGWLGSADSSYVLSAATELLDAGYAVARLNLRDHGGTEHLNLGMFHSARTGEVVDAVRELTSAGGGGVLGFSLGGNFALRVARTLHLPTLAVCPAIDPAGTMHAIDHGWIGYRWYFLRKWQRALRAKAAAFPDRYDFTAAYGLRSVAALTDLFVSRHTDFRDTADYLSRYTLTGSALAGTRATIVTAQDDPIIPWRDFQRLPDSVQVISAPWGGHCGFVEDRHSPSWIDRLATRYFQTTVPLRG